MVLYHADLNLLTLASCESGVPGQDIRCVNDWYQHVGLVNQLQRLAYSTSFSLAGYN